jgi:hypothetical protein
MQQAKIIKAATTKTWKASGASVPGRHNTPPLTRDLAPRSKDENGREEEEVKLSCFFDKRVKPNNLERLNNLKEKYNGDERDANSSLDKRNNEYDKNQEL